MTSRVFNICFHGVGAPERQLEPGEERYWITTAVFHQILDMVAHRLDIRLSFDDGNISDIQIGLPALLDRRMTATFFMLAGRLDSPGSLGRDHLQMLRDHGMSIGTHGMLHVPWRKLDPHQQRHELVEAKELLAEASGGPITEAALPLGRYDRRLLGQLKKLGYTRVYSSDRMPARPGAWMQPRFSARSEDTIDSFREMIFNPSPPHLWLRASAASLFKRIR